MHRIYSVPFADIYPMYVNKVERKGRTKAELDQAISWLTGFSKKQLDKQIYSKTTLTDFFANAVMNERCGEIKGVVCGVRVEDIQDPLMQKIRYLDKLVDEIAKGWPIEKVLRETSS